MGTGIKSLWSIFKKGIFAENPVFVLALSLCPALAVTTTALTALTMGLAVIFVISANNVVVSLTRNLVHPKVRIPVYITSISTIVTVVQLVLHAYFPVLYKALGIYLALIVVFAIILARAEVFASKNPVIPSFMDGLGMGCGFALALLIVGVIRETFGMGTIFGYNLFGPSFKPALVMILPPGAFILIGYLVAGTKILLQHMEKSKEERAQS